MQDRTEIDRLAFIRDDIFNTAWSPATVWLIVLVTANALLGGAAALWGGDWRNLVPSACVGAVVAQHVLCAVYFVWGRGRLVAKAMLQCLAIWLTAPVLAMSIRPRVAWADLKECLSALFVCAAVLTTAFAAARLLRSQICRLPSTSRPTQVHWWLLCVWLAVAMSFRPRVTGLADGGERLTALFHSAIILTVAVAGARLIALRIRQRQSAASTRRPQWSLTTIFSITTVLCIWLGMAVALGPYLTKYRHNPAHWGIMLAVDVLWIPIICELCTARPPLGARLMLIPFAIGPLALVLIAFFEVGQHDGSLQLWFAGPHQDHPSLDFLIQSGFGARLTVNEVEVGLVTAFFALCRWIGPGDQWAVASITTQKVLGDETRAQQMARDHSASDKSC